MIHVRPDSTAPGPSDTMAYCQEERDHIMANAAALAGERAAYAAVLAWNETYARSRTRMARMHGADSAALHHALKDATADAIEAHRVAEAALRSAPRAFTIMADRISAWHHGQ